MAGVDPKEAARAAWSFESAKVIARLARMVGDVGLADDLAQETLAGALATWPNEGVPADPATWLMESAMTRARDHGKREAPEAAADDVLRLVFIACHPIVPAEARVALTLRMIGGLSTDEIAGAFYATEFDIRQSIAQAKRMLVDAKLPFEVPHGDERAVGLASVLEVIYLIFNIGFSATADDAAARLGLCEDAVRFGRLVARMLPDEAEPYGLEALMALHQSRATARRAEDGAPVQLLAQDRLRWDRGHITRGLAALARADELVATRGPYAVQAGISACHARASQAEETDWERIAGLYGELGAMAPSPAIELNRAVAVAMARGPAAGLEILDAMAAEPGLAGFHLLPSARADLLVKLGRRDEARAEFERAAQLSPNEYEREVLRASAAACTA
jgi:predicted RNA polymerase sigma factor